LCSACSASPRRAFVITITLSAADATAHIIENPYVPPWLNMPVTMTLLLVAALGAVFLRGFKEAIWLAVILVAWFLAVNVIVIGWELSAVLRDPSAFSDWRVNLTTSHGGNAGMLIVAALLVFPKLALGLSGFETGVAVMPLVTGTGSTPAEILQSRIANTRRLLSTAALIMSVLLIGSSLVTTLRVPGAESAEGRRRQRRALAVPRPSRSRRRRSAPSMTWPRSARSGCRRVGDGRTAESGARSTCPRYGMAPDWARAHGR
jgi:hypothetical protein